MASNDLRDPGHGSVREAYAACQNAFRQIGTQVRKFSSDSIVDQVGNQHNRLSLWAQDLGVSDDDCVDSSLQQASSLKSCTSSLLNDLTLDLERNMLPDEELVKRTRDTIDNLFSLKCALQNTASLDRCRDQPQGISDLPNLSTKSGEASAGLSGQDSPIIERTYPGPEVLIRTSEKNKNFLLREACKAVFAGQEKAEVVLQRIKVLSPGLAKDLVLKDAALSGFPLRLLCPVENIGSAFAYVPSYLAISFCCRYDEWKPASLAAVLDPWPIAETMVNAIGTLRHEREGVWIDNPCIKQGNDKEKALVIGCMDIIYRSARQLIMILEDVRLPLDEQHTALKYAELFKTLFPLGNTENKHQFERTWGENFKPSRQEYDIIQSFIRRILSARWFERLWCFHEYKVLLKAMKPRTVILMFGCENEVLAFEFRFVLILS